MSELGDTWVIVPVLNEAGVVATVVKDLLQSFPNVVCVDDGSSDDSAAQITGTDAHLVRHPLNLGQGAALQTGLTYALRRPGARYFVTFDADGQHRVDDAVRLTEAVRSGSCDAALGSRFLDHDAKPPADRIPKPKRVVLRAVAALSPSSRRLHLTDAHNGLRALNRAVVERLHIKMNGMAHASEIVAYLSSGAWRVREMPVTVDYTDYAMSKGQSLINGVNIMFDLSLKARGMRR